MLAQTPNSEKLHDGGNLDERKDTPQIRKHIGTLARKKEDTAVGLHQITRERMSKGIPGRKTALA